MFATVEVSLSDFDLDDIIEYVEDEGVHCRESE